MLKKTTRITRKSLVKKLDELTSQIVLARDKRCITCGATLNLHVGHLFGRYLWPTRWDLKNCNAQCDRCNSRHEEDPTIYRLKWIEKYGLEEYKAMYRKAYQGPKLNDYQLKQLINELETI